MSLRSYKKALDICKDCYGAKPEDTENLIIWANLLIDLSSYEKENDPRKSYLIQDAINKLEKVLVLEPDNHHALWCIGRAYKPEISSYKQAIETTEATKVSLQEMKRKDVASGPSSATTTKDEEKRIKKIDMPLDFDPLQNHPEARALTSCESRHAENPEDTRNLTLWANLLIKIASFEDLDDPHKKHLIQEAIKKLDKVLVLQPTNHYALWCMGSAYVYISFVGTTIVEAIDHYDKALQYYKQAYDLKPENSRYKQAVEKTEATKVELQEMERKDMASGPSSTTTTKQPGVKEAKSCASQ